jgi:glycosyltransferase involved in cell wall biosynthesis
MSAVTITDHNSIEGCLEIAHLPDTFISEEVTTYFPEDGCKIHVLVYDINESIHRDIQHIRDNVYDLVRYLHSHRITFALAHPLYSVNGKLRPDHFEKALLLFSNMELNGARKETQNQCIQMVLETLTPETIARIANKYELEPLHDRVWKKNLIGGSDDHSSLTIASAHTEVKGAAAYVQFLQGVEAGKANVFGRPATPQTLAHNLYSIAYQFYGHKFDFRRYIGHDMSLSFLDNFLTLNRNRQPGIISRLGFFFSQRRKARPGAAGEQNFVDLLREETNRAIGNEPELVKLLSTGPKRNCGLDQHWFRFVNHVSNKLFCHLADHIIDSLPGPHVLNLFNSLGSAGALYCVLAPYFVAFSVFSDDRELTRHVQHRFLPGCGTDAGNGGREGKVAHFTDTAYDINGVAQTLKRQLRAARRSGRQYEVLTSGEAGDKRIDGVHNFSPVSSYELSLYPEQKLYYPPFLDMLDFCYRHNFTHIHSSTAGPVGLAALAIARILRIPIVGTYHTALPHYVHHITGDPAVSDAVWKYVLWYYDQMDTICVLSSSTAQELTSKGIDPAKMQILPPGVDRKLFHPGKRDGCLAKLGLKPHTAKLLYVGRISREKNLPLLVTVFRELCRSARNVELVVVGQGPYLHGMKEDLKGLPCTFTGSLDGEALAAVYASSDLFVFPSTTDTFGNAVLEAQASGLPVIVTDQGGPQEIIRSGETGVVTRGSDPANFLQAVRTLLQDERLRRQMGKAAREFTRQYGFEEAFDRTWQLYLETKSSSSVAWSQGFEPSPSASEAPWALPFPIAGGA